MELAVLAFALDDFGAAVGPVAEVVVRVLGVLFVRRVYGEPPKGSSKKARCFLGTRARLDVVVMVAAWMPVKVGHKLASKNLKGRDTHSCSKNLDSVVEGAKLDIVSKHTETSEDTIWRLPIILSLNVSCTQAAGLL